MLMIIWSLVPDVSASEFKPYIGLNVGYGYLSAEEKQLDKQGFDLGAKFIGSWKFENYFLDGSIGYQLEFLKADYISIQNNTPFSELSLRRMGELSIGPMVQAQSGVYSTKPTTNEDSRIVTNIGLQVVYEPDRDKIRYEVSLLNSFGSDNMHDRELSTIRIGIHIPFGSEDKSKKITHQKAPIDRKMEFPILIIPGFLTKRDYVLETNNLGFKKKSFEVDIVSHLRIEKLAAFIMANDVKIKRIEITGHADELGTSKYNKELSSKRADAVKDIFIKHNIDSKILIVSQGQGYSKPMLELKNKFSVKNRRTEIKLIDVWLSDRLNKQLSNLINKKKE
jgi:outer membrane protein OmpA-like peptidoglycan-associated protein